MRVSRWIIREEEMASIRKRAEAPVTPAAVIKAAETKVEPVKEEVKVVETKKADSKEKKAAAKKPAAVKKAVESTFYLQFQGREVSQEQLEERFKEVWTKDLGKDYADVKKVVFYVKPEELTAYFVVNDEFEGNFAI